MSVIESVREAIEDDSVQFAWKGRTVPMGEAPDRLVAQYLRGVIKDALRREEG